MPKIKTLSYGQYVTMNTWNPSDAFPVFTVEGFAFKNGTDKERAVERAIKNGHDLAGTINIGTVLADSIGYYEREEAKKNSAVVLVAGEQVLIEGRHYTVKPMGTRYSDPIHFIPA